MLVLLAKVFDMMPRTACMWPVAHPAGTATPPMRRNVVSDGWQASKAHPLLLAAFVLTRAKSICSVGYQAAVVGAPGPVTSISAARSGLAASALTAPAGRRALIRGERDPSSCTGKPLALSQLTAGAAAAWRRVPVSAACSAREAALAASVSLRRGEMLAF